MLPGQTLSYNCTTKWCLHQYVAMLEWCYNLTQVNPEFVGPLLNTYTVSIYPA